MKPFVTLLSAVAVVSAITSLVAPMAGCSGDLVLDPLAAASSAGSTTSSSTSTSTGGCIGPCGVALAMKGSEFAVGSIPWNGSDQFAPWGNPDGLVLVMSEGATATCTAPVLSSTCALPDRWQTILVIPRELDTPGSIDLEDWRIGWYSLDITNSPQAGCGFMRSGGNGFSGTLDIQTSDATAVMFTITNSTVAAGTPPNGAYTAPRCGTPPPAAVPAPALALRASKLPAGTLPDPQPDPKTLVVVVGDAPATCADPLPSIDCTGTERLVFLIPPAAQVPGMLNLSDAASGASYSIAGDASSPPCTANEGGFTQGTVQIQTITPSSIGLKVFGTYTWANAQTFEVDGLYAAAICP